MTERDVVRLGLPEERSYGYAQAVRVGDLVLVAGQTGVRDGSGPHDMEGQLRLVYVRIAEVLGRLGLGLGDVVAETIYTTDLAAAAIASVRKDVYGSVVDVASTLIGVSAIGSPHRTCPAVVEIACTAAVPAAAS